MNKEKKIALLLSTYNGEKYLDELLRSLFKQNYLNFDLIIRDDDSVDSTRSIIRKWQNNHTNIICLSTEKNLGTKESFAVLLTYAVKENYDYYMFVDQDDVWHENKIKILYDEMCQKEKLCLPILIYTDLQVVDNNLNIINNSFWQYQKIKPFYNDFNHLLVQNVVTGCTVILNKRLAKIALPFPEAAIMHDWWLALAASCFGRIFYLNYPTIFYRQHQDNVIGASCGFNAYMKKLLKENPVNKNLKQAKLFYIYYNKIMSEEKKDVLRNFLKLDEGKFKNIKIVFRYKFFKHTLIKSITFIILLILSKRRLDKDEI